MSPTQIERVKLTANAFNLIAVSFVVTGVVAPAISYLYGAGGAPHHIWIAGLWLIVGFALHALARWFLGGLDEHR